MNTAKQLFTIFFFLVITITTSCNNSPYVNEMYTEDTSSALLKISSSRNSPFSRIAKRASLSISAADLNTIVCSLSLTDTSVEGNITGIPAGNSRLFTVSVYDSLDSLQYTGTVTVDLPRGSTVNVPINIKRVSANAVINGTVTESDTSLVVNLPFNGSSKDLSGFMNNGIINGATFTTDRNGNANSAFQFDGIDDYIEIPYDTTIDCEKSVSITVWAKSAIYGHQYSVAGHILQMGWGCDAAYGIFIEPSANIPLMSFIFCTHMSEAVEQPTFEKFNAATLNGAVRSSVELDTLWHFYALTFDGAMIYAYIDNNSIGSKNAVPGPITDSLPLRIGAQSKSLDRFWKGKIDAVRIYNRALTKAEIVAISLLND